MIEEKRYTLDEVAAFFGVHKTTVRRWVKERRIRATRHGKRIIFRPEDLKEFENNESERLRHELDDDSRRAWGSR